MRTYMGGTAAEHSAWVAEEMAPPMSEPLVEDPTLLHVFKAFKEMADRLVIFDAKNEDE